MAAAGLAAGAGLSQGIAGPLGAYLPWPHLAAVFPPGTEPGRTDAVGLAGVFPGGGLAGNANPGAVPIQQACPREIDLPAAW